MIRKKCEKIKDKEIIKFIEVYNEQVKKLRLSAYEI